MKRSTGFLEDGPSSGRQPTERGLVSERGQVGVGGGLGRGKAQVDRADEQLGGVRELARLMGLLGVYGHGARGVVVPKGRWHLDEPGDVVEGGGIAEARADQRAELDGVDQVRVGGNRGVQVPQGLSGIVGPDQESHAVSGRGVPRIVGEDMLEIGAGTGRIGPQPGHGTRDPDDGVVGIIGQERLELGLGFLEPAEARQGLAACGQHGDVVAAEFDGPGEVVQRPIDPVQLEVHQGPVHERLGECRVGPQGEVVGIAGGLQLPGPGQGQPAIEVDPGELRPLDGAGREVAGGLKEPPLA